MNSSWVLDGPDIVTAFNLSSYKTMVDLGGCTGALARELAKAYPSSSVTVFDLPNVINTAKEHFTEQGDTILFKDGDFFDGKSHWRICTFWPGSSMIGKKRNVSSY